MLTVYTEWLRTQVREFVKDEEGASAVEYGLIIALIALAIMFALNQLSGGISGLFGRAADALDS